MGPGLSAITINYEIHLLQGRRWLIDSAGPDETMARELAERYSRRPNLLGVRLVREAYNPSTDRSAARILFERVRARRPAHAQPRLVVAASAPAALDAPPPTPMRVKPIGAAAEGDSMSYLAVLSIAAATLMATVVASLAVWGAA